MSANLTPGASRQRKQRRQRQLLFAGLPLLVALAAVWINWPAPRLPANATRLEIDVEGLDCALWCPLNVEAALQQLPGLLVQSVDTIHGRVRIDYDPEQVAATTILRRLGRHWRLLAARSAVPPEMIFGAIPLPANEPAEPATQR